MSKLPFCREQEIAPLKYVYGSFSSKELTSSKATENHLLSSREKLSLGAFCLKKVHP